LIDFLDLGAGKHFDRVFGMSQRKRTTKKGRPLRTRRIVAVDIAPPSRIPKGVEYAQADVERYLRALPDESVAVMNGDNLFAIHIARNRRFPSLDAKIDFAINQPIDPELFSQVKRTLRRGGRLYHTSVKWHNDALVQKLKDAGFSITTRPLTEQEAINGPETTREYYESWKQGEFYRRFGQNGWALWRLEAIKKRE